ncbi:SDR family NAD(P)-dependent oxidoreductase [Fulvimarina sp. 2208YS6-2-32]|uniref:SDR family NAD(P)-dependent oxidoreductase n=1 Tax=Fulvimarina uroteuthidis TaxID=3098149 RepID=A0ABU5I9P2_9HYPH|nr:SDR family NAD(P)-dependent oxidoreductase [Fulvimarina sp. 2208YS6-2-32]MDY8110976.1 SDR family NAD(P)-dependent oxidoreductase [Fulvimarina sp. 2208YS6-2-32]
MAFRTLIIGASGGIGQALAERCAKDGEVVQLSRRADGLDVSDEASIVRAISRLDGAFDRVFVATGVLTAHRDRPEKKLGDCDPAELAALFAINAAGPLLVLKHLVPTLARERAVRIGVLSARIGSIGDNGLGGWYAYRASKAALNQLIRTAAIELRRTHARATLLALHPGTVETPFTADFQDHHATVDAATAADNLVRTLMAHGPEDSGSFWDQNGKPIAW